MALKRNITKEAFDKLSDELKKEYKETNGTYTLETEGDEDVTALKRAKDREAQIAKEEKEARLAAEAKLAELTDGDARKNKDIETLEKSWKAKEDKAKEEARIEREKNQAFIRKTLLDSAAQGMASTISKAPAVLLPHIKSRLEVDFDGEEPALRILDKDGKKSALTIDDLKKEFVDNADFSSIIIASQASGSGASKGNPQNRASGAAPINAQQGDEVKPLSKMSPTELVAHIDAKKSAT